MKVCLRGLTKSIISFNAFKIFLHGEESTVIDVQTDAQRKEIDELVFNKLIQITDGQDAKVNPLAEENVDEPTDSVDETIEDDVSDKSEVKKTKGENKGGNKKKTKIGRPKGSKNKINKLKIRPTDTSDKENEMGSTVILATSAGPVKGKMVKTAIKDLPESEQTQASLDAMKKLEEEEAEESSKDKEVIDEAKLDPSERMGNKAVIATDGDSKSIEMVNSVLPESSAIKNRDPFINKTKATDDSDGPDDLDAFLDDDDVLEL
jgi:hypothetical protein